MEDGVTDVEKMTRGRWKIEIRPKRTLKIEKSLDFGWDGKYWEISDECREGSRCVLGRAMLYVRCQDREMERVFECLRLWRKGCIEVSPPSFYRADHGRFQIA